MNTVERYSRPPDLAAALAAAASDPDAVWLAGGTSLLAGDYSDKPASVIDIGSILPRGITVHEGTIAIGADTTFQELAEASAAPALLKEAALGVGSRNVRNRATVGGNIAADRSSSALIPALLVLDAKLEIAVGGATRPASQTQELASWLSAPSGLILSISFRDPASRRSGYGRWSRTSNDTAILVAALSFTIEKSSMKNLRIAMGGIATKSRRMSELEKRFENMPIPAEDDSGEDFRSIVEKAALPFLVPAEGGAVSASFRKLRGATLLAEVMAKAVGLTGTSDGSGSNPSGRAGKGGAR
jgi:putative selenate reductase FAD-binding subunit